MIYELIIVDLYDVCKVGIICQIRSTYKSPRIPSLSAAAWILTNSHASGLKHTQKNSCFLCMIKNAQDSKDTVFKSDLAVVHWCPIFEPYSTRTIIPLPSTK